MKKVGNRRFDVPISKCADVPMNSCFNLISEGPEFTIGTLAYYHISKS
jgi:hypothetical protein